MSNYLIVHKDHPLNVDGVNSGAEMATLYLAQFLAKEGHKVCVAGQLTQGDCVKDGVEYWNLGQSYDIESALKRIRQVGDYHLISAGRPQPFFMVSDDQHCLSKILISHDLSGLDIGLDLKIVTARTDKIICVSEAQKAVLIKNGVNPEHLVTIRNGADLDKFSVGDIENRDWHKLVFVGALVQDKGLQVLLGSYSKLKAKYPNLTLDIYGSADMWGRKEIFDTKTIESQLPGVTFKGKVPQPQIAKAFQECGICVVPSIWTEALPLTAIEAQVSGCPVVAFNVGGLPECVRDGETGRITPDISEDGLTIALDNLLKDRMQLLAMSKQAVNLQRPYFNWERVAKEVGTLSSKIAQQTTNKADNNQISIGIMSTWNQRCGLATYAKFLTSEIKDNEITIFAEDNNLNRTKEDESNVIRCWSWKSQDWNKLIHNVVDSKINVLLVNAHNPQQLSDSNFENVITALQEKGIRVVILIHSVFTKREGARVSLQAANGVIVHTPEMKLEIAAYEVNPEKIHVINHGVRILEAISNEKIANIRNKFNLPQNKQLVTAVGFIQPHKGIEGLIDAVYSLSNLGQEIHGCIAGMPNSSDPNSESYLQQLKDVVRSNNLSEKITFIEKFLEDSEVSEILQASDAVMMNYHSQHYEASGACSLALGAGCRVITSIAPPFQGLGAAVWHITSGFPATLALKEILNNSQVQQLLDNERKKYLLENSWQKTAEKFLEVMNRSMKQILNNKKEHVVANSNITNPLASGAKHRILIQNRSNMYSQRGGDTILVEQLVTGLKTRGYLVDLDLQGEKDPSSYDLVHLVNFAIPDMIRTYGQRAKNAGVPFVVTTLCEDVPSFHTQSRTLANTLVDYVANGQDSEWFQKNATNYKLSEPCKPFDNQWSAQNAAALLVNGLGEKRVIEKTYTGHAPIFVTAVGYEIGASAAKELFEREYQIKDFIFCVGRLESRKNQLMLLKALEEVDLPLVFASGGFTYQPEYAEAVRKFKRKGQTIVLDRLSPEMLSSAYAAAKLHALPSWYELPGLVSLEALMQGANVVVSDSGTTRDYLGNYGFYCQPDNEESIRNAVLAAYYSPFKAGAKEHIAQFSWQAATDQVIAAYEDILQNKSKNSIIQIESSDSSQVVIDTKRFEELAEKGFAAANEKRLDEAHQYLAEAEEINPKAIRVICNRAAVYLAQEDVISAAKYFEKALQIDANDPRARSGYGMCLMMQGNKEQAYEQFVLVLKQDPYQLVAILQLMDCAYALNRFNDLEMILTNYLTKYPDNFDMRYCLAGCLLKTGDLNSCRKEVSRLLQERPDHQGTIELDNALKLKEKEVADTLVDKALKNVIERRSIEFNQEQKNVQTINFATDTIKTQPFDSIDLRISELEELKHRRELEEALSGCEVLLNRGDLSDHQRSSCSLLKYEIKALFGEIDEAEGGFNSILAKMPNSSRALCGLGALAASRSEYSKAEEYFTKALVDNPKFDKAFAGLAFCNMQQGKYSQAWELYEKSLTANPENLSALLGSVQLGYQLERLPQLQQHLERYLEMHPADLNMVYSYAGCLYAQNRLEEALSEVEKILLFQSEDTRAFELKDAIEQKLNGSSLAM